jgi:microcystin-dependent protein
MTVRKLAAALLACGLAVSARAAAPLPHAFTAGTPAKAAEVNANFTNLADRIAANMPVGTVLPYAGTGAEPPAGFLFCDGTVVAILAQPALFAALGTTYGGDGTTNFALPNLQARFPVGAGSGLGGTFDPALGTTGGEAVHVLTTAEMPSHKHGVTDPGHAHAMLPMYGLSAGVGGTSTEMDYNGSAEGRTPNTATATTGITETNATGGGNAHNTIPPFLALRWIIKT